LARLKTSFTCQNCAAIYSQWNGKCENCGEWNSIVEELTGGGIGAGPKSVKAGGYGAKLVSLAGQSEDAIRIKCGIDAALTSWTG